MAWSTIQQRMFVAAAGRAQMNDAQRYIALAHVGCRSAKRRDGRVRPSVKELANTQAQFELAMAICEAHAAERGATVPPPSTKSAHATWADASRDLGSRVRDLCIALWDGAVEAMPRKFAAGGLDGFVQRQTMHDSTSFGAPGVRPTTIHGCDEGQAYRVLEGLKAWIARERKAHGLAPLREEARWHGRASKGGGARAAQSLTTGRGRPVST